MNSLAVRSSAGVVEIAGCRFSCSAACTRLARLARRPGLRLQIFVDAFAPAFAAEAGFAVAAEADGGIEEIGGIHPHHAALQLGRDVERQADGLAPHAGRKAVARVVGQHHRLIRRAEGHAHQHRAEDFLRRTRSKVGCTLVSSVGGKKQPVAWAASISGWN